MAPGGPDMNAPPMMPPVIPPAGIMLYDVSTKCSTPHLNRIQTHKLVVIVVINPTTI
jgi:hypothetical protein